jgi:hypothetical protein
LKGWFTHKAMLAHSSGFLFIDEDGTQSKPRGRDQASPGEVSLPLEESCEAFNLLIQLDPSDVVTSVGITIPCAWRQALPRSPFLASASLTGGALRGGSHQG